MSDAWDVVVVGAGIVGAACARECATRGLRTAIVESSGVGSGATAAAMGHVVLMNDSPAQFALTHYSQNLWRGLAACLPADVEFEQRGTLWIAADEEEMEEVRRKHRVFAASGVASEILDSDALAEAEPHLRRPMTGALLVPSDVVLDPSRAAAWLMEQAVRAGATLYAPRRVMSTGAGRVQIEDGAELHAGRIVIACGAESANLVPGLPIRKRKGHLAITDRQPGLVRHQLVELGYLKSAHTVTADSVAFNVQPRRSGQILVGSSRQYGDEETAVNPAILAAMLERAKVYLPELGECVLVRTWTGFRAATPDKLPLIGPWPADATVLLATGHEGLGITTSLGTARLIADQVMGARAEIPVAPYWPGRLFSAQARVTRDSETNMEGR
jgi:glycine/D-amino acid oxidase-like deaminating enzyme